MIETPVRRNLDGGTPHPSHDLLRKSRATFPSGEGLESLPKAVDEGAFLRNFER